MYRAPRLLKGRSWRALWRSESADRCCLTRQTMGRSHRYRQQPPSQTNQERRNASLLSSPVEIGFTEPTRRNEYLAPRGAHSDASALPALTACVVPAMARGIQPHLRHVPSPGGSGLARGEVDESVVDALPAGRDPGEPLRGRSVRLRKGAFDGYIHSLAGQGEFDASRSIEERGGPQNRSRRRVRLNAALRGRSVAER